MMSEIFVLVLVGWGNWKPEQSISFLNATM